MNPLIFFAVVIVIDLILKSAKEKKKIEKTRERKLQQSSKEKKVEVPQTRERRVKREIQKNPSLSKEKDSFFGEGKSYREDYEGYEERYEKRYDKIDQTYKDKDIRSDRQAKSLYDKNAIQVSDKKDYDKKDVRNYGRDKEKIELPIPTASTFKDDVLKGIIFSEILGKPKSMQKRDI